MSGDITIDEEHTISFMVYKAVISKSNEETPVHYDDLLLCGAVAEACQIDGRENNLDTPIISL